MRGLARELCVIKPDWRFICRYLQLKDLYLLRLNERHPRLIRKQKHPQKKTKGDKAQVSVSAREETNQGQSLASLPRGMLLAGRTLAMASRRSRPSLTLAGRILAIPSHRSRPSLTLAGRILAIPSHRSRPSLTLAGRTLAIPNHRSRPSLTLVDQTLAIPSHQHRASRRNRIRNIAVLRRASRRSPTLDTVYLARTIQKWTRGTWLSSF